MGNKRTFVRRSPVGKIDLVVPPVPLSSVVPITGSGTVLRYMFPADGQVKGLSIKVEGTAKKVSIRVKTLNDKTPGTYGEFVGKPTGYDADWVLDVHKGDMLSIDLIVDPVDASVTIWASCLYYIDAKYDQKTAKQLEG
jgi:hypothetical protein